MTEHQRQRALVEWSGTATDYPRDSSIHELFEKVAAQAPDADAVLFGETRITYGELNERANRLARYLTRRGVGTEALVGLCVERSVEMVVGLLAILKAGGAYVPLDPQYPRERLAFLLEDTSARIVLTSEKLVGILPEGFYERVRLDTDWPQIVQESGENLSGTANAKSLAYVMYTSGSTGVPKGVSIPHRGVVRLVRGTDYADFGPDEVFLQFASISFDVSTFEIWGALLNGSRLAVMPPGTPSIEELGEEITRYKVSTLWLTAGLFNQVVENGIESLRGVRQLVAGGEALSASHVEKALRELPNCRLINGYGPTENTTFTCCHTFRRDESLAAGVPIGRPISNTRAFILDSNLEPVPIGVPGELYTGGDGLARGYFRRPELTAEKFVRNPFRAGDCDGDGDGDGDDRLYRTGDRASYASDGTILFLGRIDNQVKIRGFRIEPGEIESVLAHHPCVADSLVIAREDAPGDRRLVAYMICRGKDGEPRPDLREFLAARLPDHMVPSAFVFLDAFPLTAHGKVDRQALPAPSRPRSENDDYVAPRTPVETAVTAIWAAVLHVDRVGVFDNFFTLGGHSLLATQVISRISDVLRARLPIKEMFVEPTVAALAARVVQKQTESVSPADLDRLLKDLETSGSKGFPMGGELDRRNATSSVAERLARLPPEARAILERWLGEKSLSPVPEAIPRREENAAGPLSFAQQRLWILDRLDPDLDFYNVPRAFRLQGSLDVEALGRAVNTIQDRHEVLRCTFPLVNGTPVQVAGAPGASSQSVVDLVASDESTREGEARRTLEEESRRPFDLARGPLLRTTLLRLSDREHILLINVHHIVFDGWSAHIFDEELGALYAAYREGREPTLPPLALQYADFAVWQRRWLQGEIRDEQIAYWKRQLDGAPPALRLSVSRPRPPAQTFRGAAETVWIPEGAASAIRSLCQREGTTLFMTLLAAFQLLLRCHSGQDDILVGSPVAGRNRSDIEGLIGFFVNTLVLRTDLSGDPTFRELLMRVRDVAIEAYAHQDLPFEKLVEELNPERTLSYSPVFQVMMILQNAPSSALALEGVSSTPIRLDVAASKFDLTAIFEDAGGRIRASFQYNTDLLDASTVRRMLSQLQGLLEAAAKNSTQRLSELPLLTGPQRRPLSEPPAGGEQNRVASSDRHRSRGSALAEDERRAPPLEGNRIRPLDPFLEFAEEEIEQSIAARFRQQALRHSSRIAVRTRAHSWTYERLAHEADRAAEAILELTGDGPTRVALLFDQDAPMIAAILGSLKAGGTYVPLDPSYPAERLEYMVRDSAATVILTNDGNLSLAKSLGEGTCSVANLDRPPRRKAVSTPPAGIGPEAMAYILYTSGSTGRPKGVVQNHRNVLHFTRVYTNALHIRADDRLSLLASYSFDAAVMDIFGALLNGATLCLWSVKTQGVAGLAEWLAKEEITILHAVPTVFRAFAGTLGVRQQFPGVRLVVLGGEEAHRGDVEVYRKHFPPPCLFVNGLGPTESTMALQYFLDHTTEGVHAGSVPVGYPVDNTEIVLLDEEGRATELHGEIGVRSPYLALEYWRQPQLTRAAFLPDPEGGRRRIYRTGDLGSFLPDGAIRFLGRKGSLVKIRGHRVELGEIESVLAEHPDIAEVVVMLRDDIRDEKRLAAYVVPNSRRSLCGDPVDAGDERALVRQLRALARDRLPDYMHPAAIVMLDSLPLLPNGKVDRRALPPPEPPGDDDSFVAPRNDVEANIARIWCEVLGLGRVGVHDNFFDLGGHSLLAVRLVTCIEKQFGEEVALATIFRAPTVAELAEMFQGPGRSKRASASLVAIQPRGARPTFFCVHAVGGVVTYRLLARSIKADQPFYGLQSQGLDGARAPYETVEEMAAHYVHEIRGLQPEGPYYIGGYSFGGKVAFEMARQLAAQGQRTAFLAFLDTLNLPILPGPTRLDRARERTRVHIEALRVAGMKERMSYLMQRAQTLRILLRRALSRGHEVLFRPLRGAQRRVLEANSRASRRYVPSSYEGRATIFRAMDQTKDFHDRLLTYPNLGWETLCGGGIELVEVPGGHSSLMEEEANVRALGAILGERLREAQDTEIARSDRHVIHGASHTGIQTVNQ